MGEKPKFYITTAIAYTSRKPHIGNSYEIVLTDAIARYKRMLGYDVFFLTGTDEHGQKIEEYAKEAGVTPKEYVDKVAGEIRGICDSLNTTYDKFIRTTDDYHEKTVQKIFKKLYDQGDIYKSEYEGLYCTPCESFWTESQLDENGCCPDCHRPVQKAKEEAYFLRLSKYQKQLEEFIESHENFIYPEARKKEMLNNFIKPGLQDLCVSRTSFKWGIPVTFDPKHVVYVWVDALSNYITALGYDPDGSSDLYKKYWPADVHIIGKDIVRFHTIYWPMFLMALGLREPSHVFVHGLMMMKDGKMSKSKGNVIPVPPLVDHFGVDAIRYYLTREIIFGQDGEFTPEQFVERLNVDLANNLGNLLNRTVSMIEKYFGGEIPAYEGDLNDLDKNLYEAARETVENYETLSDSLKVTEAYAAVMDLVSKANKYIEESAPWALAKDPDKKPLLASCMAHLAGVLFLAGELLSPILITKSKELFDQLGLGEAERTYEKAVSLCSLGGHHVVKGSPLFPRLDAAKEVEFIKALMAAPKEKAAA